MTVVTSPTATSESSSPTSWAVTDHPIRFRDAAAVRAWLVGCEALPLIAEWMGGEPWRAAAEGLREAARSDAPVALNDLDALRALVGLEHADTPWSRQSIWLQGVDLEDPRIWAACAFSETLETACTVLRRSGAGRARVDHGCSSLHLSLPPAAA